MQRLVTWILIAITSMFLLVVVLVDGQKQQNLFKPMIRKDKLTRSRLRPVTASTALLERTQIAVIDLDSIYDSIRAITSKSDNKNSPKSLNIGPDWFLFTFIYKLRF